MCRRQRLLDVLRIDDGAVAVVLRVGHHVPVDELELRFVDRLVHGAPVDVLLALGFANDKLVIG